MHDKIEQMLPLNEILKKRRCELGLDISDVQRTLKISRQHLRSMEEGDFSRLPPEIYTKNFIKNYAAFLSIDDENKVNEFIGIFSESYQRKNQAKLLKTYLNGADSQKIWDIPKLLQKGVSVILLIIVLSYIGVEIQKMRKSPDIHILEPENNIVTSESSIAIVGKSENDAEIRINDEIVILDGDAVFQKQINLDEGINTIKITAKRKHSKQSEILRQILYEAGKTDSPSISEAKVMTKR